jgi:hypothetical protein
LFAIARRIIADSDDGSSSAAGGHQVRTKDRESAAGLTRADPKPADTWPTSGTLASCLDSKIMDRRFAKASKFPNAVSAATLEELSHENGYGQQALDKREP